MSHRRRTETVLAERGGLQVIADPDPARPGGRQLRQDGMDASYIDLEDPRYLAFDYLRWIRTAIATAGLAEGRVLHLGGGAGALARALLAEWPRSRQELCEIEPDVIDLARQHMGLRSGRGLRVHVGDGLAHLDAQPDGRFDAVVIDAFVDGRPPAQLVHRDAIGSAARVAALLAVNLVPVNGGAQPDRVARTAAEHFADVLTLARPGANAVVVASRAPVALDEPRLRAALARDPSPPRVVVDMT